MDYVIEITKSDQNQIEITISKMPKKEKTAEEELKEKGINWRWIFSNFGILKEK